MRLSTRIGAAVAGLALAIVGWAAPAAYADNSGGTRTASSYEDLYEAKYPDRSYFCQKFEPSEGSTYGSLVDGGKAISLKPFQSSWEGDQWGLLMVKGGSVEGGEAIYELPNANEAYYPPLNNGGQKPDVSHWIVCGMSAGWDYDVTCEAVDVDYPGGISGIEINVRFRNLDTDEQKTLTYKPGGTLPDPATFTYADHADWPGWTYYAVEWVQVDGNNYHWDDGVECGEPEPEPVLLDYCVWDGDSAAHVTLEEDETVPAGYILWPNYSAQAPAPEGCEPPPVVDLCRNIEGNQDQAWLDEGGWTASHGKCERTIYVCWEMPNDGMDLAAANYRLLSGGDKQPVINGKAFPQAYLAQGDSFADLAANDCGEEAPVCESDTWLQLDKYTVKSEAASDRLDALLESGTLTWKGGPSDSEFYIDHRFIQLDGGDCPEPVKVQVCKLVGDTWTGTWMLQSERDAAPAGTYRAWTGDPQDCFGFSGDVDLCHADGDGGYTLMTVGWTAEWDGSAWVFDIEGDHQSDSDDIIDKIERWEGPYRAAYDGQNIGPDTDGWAVLHDNRCEDVVGVCVQDEGQKHWETIWVRESEAETTYADNPRPSHHSCETVRDSVEICHALGEGQYELLSLPWTVIGSTITGFDPDEFEESGHGSHSGDVIPAFTITDINDNVVYEFAGLNTDLGPLIDMFGCDPVEGTGSATSSSSEICTAPGGTYGFDVTVSSEHGSVVFSLQRSNGDGTCEDLGAIGDAVDRGETANFTGVVDRAGDYRVIGTAAPAPLLAVMPVAQGEGVEALPAPLDLYTALFTVTPPSNCATIDGTVVTGVCADGIPFLDYTVVLDDPQGEVTIPEVATLTFVNDTTADGGTDFVYEVPLETPVGGGTYTDPQGVAGMDTITYSYADGVHTWTGHALWPGGSVDASGTATGWPGWELQADGSYTEVTPENYGWTRAVDGVEIMVAVNPETTVSATYPAANPECDGPPPVEICVATGDGGWEAGEISAADYAANTDAYTLWDEEAANNGCPEPPQEATLEGSVISSVCVADSPWVRYSLTLTDPENTADYDRDDPTPVTITWVHPTDPSKNYTVDVALGSGYVLWPGAAVEPAEGYTEDQIDPTNPDTFVPTDWPGWGVDENGDWFAYDDPEVDYGWTRDGVEVTAEINPTFSVSLSYPPPTPTCTSEPPTTTTVVLDAPPPTAARVEDITYTG